MNVSIIVPIYNSDKTLRRCIESILAQNYTDFELLLIDDGSTDDSWQICEEFTTRNPRIRAIRQENGGVSNARNKGIHLSRGSYITFIDSDDYITNKYLTSFDYCGKYDFQIQGFTLTYSHSNENKAIYPSQTHECNTLDILEECEINSLIRGPVCKLFKKEILTKNNLAFDESLSYGEDAIFVKRYLLCCTRPCRTISESNYIYTHDSDSSLTSSYHSGERLYQATLIEYQLFNKLRELNPDMSNKLVQHFKRLKAIDTYQAVRRVILDSSKGIEYKVKFIHSLSPNLMSFVESAQSLPVKFSILRWFINNRLSGNYSIRILAKILQ